MSIKNLSLILGQTLFPFLTKKEEKTKIGSQGRDSNSTISKKERKRRTKHKKAVKKQNLRARKR